MFVYFHNLMETLTLLFLSLSLTYTASHGATICPTSSCRTGGPPVRFPFQLINRQNNNNNSNDNRCGYYDLSCDSRNQTILNLPKAGDFNVTKIDYVNQLIFVNDPNHCLPKRILNFTLSGSPFRGAYVRNVTFLNCSTDRVDYVVYRAEPIYCLPTSPNYTVVAAADLEYVPPTCQNMSTVPVPVQFQFGYNRDTADLNRDLPLKWWAPSCGSCEAAGGTCRFKSDTDSEVGCFNVPTRQGLPRSAKYGIIVGVGIPGLVCLIALACCICSKIKSYGRNRQIDAELSNSAIIPQTAIILTGLDGPTIESYPKVVLGESRRLPNPNDVTCPICLAEYQPKETLRIIPECNHYFHATCIDEWLKLNATCPLCRKSPEGSFVGTPSSPMSLTSSSSSLSSTS